jgi:phage portal protein BeeE
MAITLKKTMQVYGSGLYIKDSSQNYATRTFASGTNYSATSLSDVRNLARNLSSDIGTMRVNRSFVIS